ncbi:hypothetical protein V8E51_010998 [Hyaloscypha variabilis]
MKLGILCRGPGYRAGCREWPKATSVFKVLKDSNNVQVSGLSIDRVKTVVLTEFEFPGSDNPDIARQALEWETSCLALAQEVYSMYGAVPEQCWRTLIANKRQTRLPCTTNFIDAYHNMVRSFKHRMTSEDSMSDFKEEIRALREYIILVAGASYGRRYFATENSRIGLGPEDTAPGDLVCVFNSGPVPYILRRRQNNLNYVFLGESYVHGLMNTEVLDMLD